MIQNTIFNETKLFLFFLHCVVGVAIFENSLCPQVPSCDCRPNADKFDIYCTQLSNLSVVQDLLQTQFANKSINKLMLQNCSVTVLPDDVFENVSMLILISSCPLEDIKSNALLSIRNLSKIILSNSTFSKIPSGLRDLANLKTLNIWFHKLEMIEDDFMNLTSLLFISIMQGTLKALAENSFVYTPNVIYLDLSYNKLQYLHPNTFDPLRQLQRISIRGNRLLTAGGFLKNLNPQVIDMYDNNITDMKNIFHNNMWAAKSLNIGKNPIKFINASSFTGKMMNLQILDLSASKYSEVDPKLLQSFRVLKEVNMQRNKLTEIPKGFFHNLQSLRNIVLTGNNLTSINGAFTDNPQLEKLLLSRNKIKNIVNGFENLPNLGTLYLGNNRIEGIYNGDFATVPLLQKLILSYNRIQRLDRHCFAGLTKLNVLELSANKFYYLNSSIQNLFALQTFEAKSGQLKGIEDNELVGLPKLTDVNLVKNKMVTVNGAFRNLLSLKTLNIAKNKLQTLSWDTFPENIKVQELWLGAGNRWACDCRLLWLVEWLSETNGTFLLDEPLCRTPKRLQRLPLRKLTVQDVTLWPDNCPDPCQCKCQPQKRDFYISVNCSYKKLSTVPQLLPEYLGELDLQDNLLANVSSMNTSLIRDLQILNMRNNWLTSFDLKLPGTMEVLLLDGNNLTRFPWLALENQTLSEVTLSRNPWICDCVTTDFRKWLLSEGDIVTDVNETRCGDIIQNGKLSGKVITSLKDTDLCPSVIGMYVSIAIGALSLLLVTTSLVLGYSRYHLHLKVWLYARGLTFVKEEDMDKNKPFDAFLSNSPFDDDFAYNTIAPGLEREEPRFTLCIPERNILAGTHEIVDKMLAVTMCKRIIVILTQNYMENESCMEIFRTSFSISLEDKVHRVIVIKYGDITPEGDMDPALKTVLESTNCIQWKEKLFWEKLRYNMPKKRKIDRTNSQQVGVADAIPLLT